MKVRSGILVTAFAPGYRHFHLKHNNNNYVDGKYHDFVLLVKIQDESIVFVGFSFDVFDCLLMCLFIKYFIKYFMKEIAVRRTIQV